MKYYIQDKMNEISTTPKLLLLILWFAWLFRPKRRDCWGGMVYTGKNPPKDFVEVDMKEFERTGKVQKVK